MVGRKHKTLRIQRKKLTKPLIRNRSKTPKQNNQEQNLKINKRKKPRRNEKFSTKA